jgi:hypothetical protein
MAREVSTDAADKMNSIIKIIDKFTFGVNRAQLKAEQEKLEGQQIAMPATYTIATSWHLGEKLKKDTFMTFKTEILDPHHRSLGGPEQEHLLPAGTDKVNMNFNMQGVPITEEGHYVLKAQLVSKEGKTLVSGTYPFEVELVDGPPLNTGTVVV